MAFRKKKSLLDQAADYVEQVRPQVESAVASALDAVEDFYENTARPALLDAKDKAGPALADAREKARRTSPRPARRPSRWSPLAPPRPARWPPRPRRPPTPRSPQLRSERRSRRRRRAASSRSSPSSSAIAAAVGFVASKLQGSGQSDNWQSSYIPTPAPDPDPSAPADDAGAATPDEAIADAADEPRPATTPDEPARRDSRANRHRRRRRRRPGKAHRPAEDCPPRCHCRRPVASLRPAERRRRYLWQRSTSRASASRAAVLDRGVALWPAGSRRSRRRSPPTS